MERRFFACPCCKLNGYHVDDLLGFEGFLSPRMLRFSASSVAKESFRASQNSLNEYLGVHTSPETLRKYVESAATAMLNWQESESVGAAFAQASGNIEFQIDAGKVNTLEGWRDFKICTFAKRPGADPATPNEWDTRVLPKVTSRVTVAALESIDVFEKRLRPLAAHLGIQDTCTIHTLGDGAEWIWNTATRQFPGGTQTLDIYHGCEWISDTSKLLYPETRVSSQPPKVEQATPPQICDTMSCDTMSLPSLEADTPGLLAATATESIDASPMTVTPEVPSAPITPEKAPTEKTAKRCSSKLSAAEKAKAKQAKRIQQKQARAAKPKTEQQKSYERGREQLLDKGWQGICDYMAEELAKGDTPERRSSMEGLMHYFMQHIGRLNYKEQLSAGLVIGSGMVEGNVKTLGLRLKARGARWKVGNVTRIAALIGLRHSNHWHVYWSTMGSRGPQFHSSDSLPLLSMAA